jgi:hypothetical protein
LEALTAVAENPDLLEIYFSKRGWQVMTACGLTSGVSSISRSVAAVGEIGLFIRENKSFR